MQFEGLNLYLGFCHCHRHSHNAYQQYLPYSSVQSYRINFAKALWLWLRQRQEKQDICPLLEIHEISASQIAFEIHDTPIIKHWPSAARILKFWTLYYIALTLWCTSFFIPQKTCFSRPYCMLWGANGVWEQSVPRSKIL